MEHGALTLLLSQWFSNSASHQNLGRRLKSPCPGHTALQLTHSLWVREGRLGTEAKASKGSPLPQWGRQPRLPALPSLTPQQHSSAPLSRPGPQCLLPSGPYWLPPWGLESSRCCLKVLHLVKLALCWDFHVLSLGCFQVANFFCFESGICAAIHPPQHTHHCVFLSAKFPPGPAFLMQGSPPFLLKKKHLSEYLSLLFRVCRVFAVPCRRNRETHSIILVVRSPRSFLTLNTSWLISFCLPPEPFNFSLRIRQRASWLGKSPQKSVRNHIICGSFHRRLGDELAGLARFVLETGGWAALGDCRFELILHTQTGEPATCVQSFFAGACRQTPGVSKRGLWTSSSWTLVGNAILQHTNTYRSRALLADHALIHRTRSPHFDSSDFLSISIQGVSAFPSIGIT